MLATSTVVEMMITNMTLFLCVVVCNFNTDKLLIIILTEKS